MINTSLGRILTHSEATKRLIKWATELSEYDIEYQSRQSIKTLALADFVVETVHQEEADEWMVFVNGSSTNESSGVEVVLVSPQREEIKLIVRLHFWASNNEEEYDEALQIGL